MLVANCSGNHQNYLEHQIFVYLKKNIFGHLHNTECKSMEHAIKLRLVSIFDSFFGGYKLLSTYPYFMT